jgi:hypothetical protein
MWQERISTEFHNKTCADSGVGACGVAFADMDVDNPSTIDASPHNVMVGCNGPHQLLIAVVMERLSSLEREAPKPTGGGTGPSLHPTATASMNRSSGFVPALVVSTS